MTTIRYYRYLRIVMGHNRRSAWRMARIHAAKKAINR